MPFIPRSPPPPKESIDDADLLPEATAGWYNLLTFGWITQLLALGYARPLEAPDLYRLEDHRSAKVIGDKITASYEARVKKASEYNARLAKGEISPGWRAIWWSLSGKRAEKEKQWREIDGRQRASLVWAMNDSIAYWFWSGGLLKLVADIATILTPLLVKVSCFFSLCPVKTNFCPKAIINFGSESYTYVPIPRTSIKNSDIETVHTRRVVQKIFHPLDEV